MKLNYRALSPALPLVIDGIVSVHYFEYTGDFRYDGEQHDFWELVYCDKGPLVITAGERELTLETRELYLHPPMQFHNIRTDGTHSASSVIVSFTGELPMLDAIADRVISSDGYLRSALFAILREARLSFGNRLGQVLDERLIRRKDGGAFASEQVLLRELELLLIHLVRGRSVPDGGSTPPSGTDSDRLAPILEYLEESVRERLSVADVSRRFSISPTTLKKLFASRLGMGVMSYFLDCRMREAKKLIREEEKSFSEIALELGFASVHHFSRIFKQKIGMTPTEYGRSVRAMLEAAVPADSNDFVAR